MEIFSHNYATAYGRSYAVTDEEYLQESLDPPNRLTTRELNQLREIREEIESRPRITRFEKRYIRVLEVAEQEFCGVQENCAEGIRYLRNLLKDLENTVLTEKRSIAIALLCATVAKEMKN